MENQNDIDVLFQQRYESLKQDLIGLCGRAGLQRDRVDIIMKGVNALCGLYLLKQLKESELLSADAVAKFAHID